jgi:hypothetical protein
MIYVGLTTVPIMTKETDKRTKRDKQLLEKHEYTNLKAFTWWFVTLIFNVMFIVMHSTNFPDRQKKSVPLYLFLILGINLPWTLSCVRNYIVVPDTPIKRIFVIAFDTFVTKPFFRNHLILQLLSIQGFQNTQYFTLMLFDIVNLNDRLANIVQALSFHRDSLGLVFYLFITTALTYASFGLQFFPEAFQTTYDGETVEFKTVLSCFWFVFYNYASRGNLKAVLSKVEPKSADWLPRILFDTIFFVWVSVILFTTITALLVDALGKARVDKAKRDNEERNVCFMCGLTRADYDDYGLKPGSPDFDDHINKDHNPWIYVSYVAYLRSKPSNKYTGIETYARMQVDKKESWVPSKTCVALELQGKIEPPQVEDEEAKEEEKKEKDETVMENSTDFEKICALIAEMQKNKANA